MVHILTALYPEALPIIEYFGLKKDFNYNEFEHFKKDDLSLSITGVGGIKAASVFSYLFSQKKDDFFLLTGVCGAKNKDINIGDIFLINKAIQNDSKKKFYPDIIFSHNLKENSIESFGKVINSYDSEIEGELIDMESAYFLEAAQFFSSPHKSQVLKIVSDHLDVKNITKDFISEIVEKNLKNINDIINNLLELSILEKKETLSLEENEVLLAIKENLNLTEYMKNELFSLYRISKVRKNISIENLKEFLLYKAKTKQERKKYYDNIKNALL